MKCQKCGSERVAYLFASHSDRFNMNVPADGFQVEADYAPVVPGLCGNDNTNFEVCLDCGQMQGDFPKEKVRK